MSHCKLNRCKVCKELVCKQTVFKRTRCLFAAVDAWQSSQASKSALSADGAIHSNSLRPADSALLGSDWDSAAHNEDTAAQPQEVGGQQTHSIAASTPSLSNLPVQISGAPGSFTDPSDAAAAAADFAHSSTLIAAGFPLQTTDLGSSRMESVTPAAPAAPVSAADAQKAVVAACAVPGTVVLAAEQMSDSLDMPRNEGSVGAKPFEQPHAHDKKSGSQADGDQAPMMLASVEQGAAAVSRSSDDARQADAGFLVTEAGLHLNSFVTDHGPQSDSSLELQVRSRALWLMGHHAVKTHNA